MDTESINSFPIIFTMLALMVSVWFVKISQFFNYLKSTHPAEFEAIGSPSLITNNTPSNNIKSLKFILGKRPAELNDELLMGKCRFLKRFFYIYMALIVGLPVAFLITSNAGS